MSDPILTGEQVRAIREDLGLTQEALATQLGFTGALRRQAISRIESGRDDIGFVRGNLLLAMDAGYKPVGVPAGELPIRQIEVLEAARKSNGYDAAIRSKNKPATRRGRGGGFIRMLKSMEERGLITAKGELTEDGKDILTDYKRRHPTRLSHVK